MNGKLAVIGLDSCGPQRFKSKKATAPRRCFRHGSGRMWAAEVQESNTV
jgi:hypothetical protein